METIDLHELYLKVRAVIPHGWVLVRTTLSGFPDDRTEEPDFEATLYTDVLKDDQGKPGVHITARTEADILAQIHEYLVKQPTALEEAKAADDNALNGSGTDDPSGFEF